MRSTILVCGLMLASLSCESSTEVVGTDIFRSDLTTAKVKPTAPTGTGSGSLTITLKSNTTRLSYELSFAGLTSAATAAHIHGPADTNTVVPTTMPPLVDFGAVALSGDGTIQLGTSGSAKGSIDLKSTVSQGVSGDSLFKLLNTGFLYVDVHTTGNTAGELRGQILKQ